MGVGQTMLFGGAKAFQKYVQKLTGGSAGNANTPNAGYYAWVSGEILTFDVFGNRTALKIKPSGGTVNGLGPQNSGAHYFIVGSSVVKVSAAGALVWQKTITYGTPFNAHTPFGVVEDTAGNAFVIGTVTRISNGSYTYSITCLDASSGAVVFGRYLTVPESGNSIADFSYVSCSDGYVAFLISNVDQHFFVKINSSGTLAFSKETGANAALPRICEDTSGNLITLGGNNNPSVQAFKYNSAGTFQWSKTIWGSVGNTYYNLGHPCADASGNIYAATSGGLLKLSSAGVGGAAMTSLNTLNGLRWLDGYISFTLSGYMARIPDALDTSGTVNGLTFTTGTTSVTNIGSGWGAGSSLTSLSPTLTTPSYTLDAATSATLATVMAPIP